MTRPAVTYPNVEVITVDYLAAVLPDYTEHALTVGVGLPSTWTIGAAPHVQVELDGVPVAQHPVLELATVRVTVWADSSPVAIDLAHVCLGLLTAHPGGSGINGYRYLTGPLPATDPDHRAVLASITVRALVRSVPLEPLGS